MNLFKIFFKTKTINKEPNPNPGELWELTDDSPWPKNVPPVTVLAVKDGWVRYDMPPLFMDQRMELKDFLRMYKKVN